ACAGIAGFHGKRTEAAQFDTVALRQCAGNFIEHRVDDFLDIAQEKMGIAVRQLLDEFGFGHAFRLLNLLIYNQNAPKQACWSSKTLIAKDFVTEDQENRRVRP